MNWASMPEAPIKEYCYLGPQKGDIHCSPEAGNDRLMEAIPQPSPKELSSKIQLQVSIPLTYSSHT